MIMFNKHWSDVTMPSPIEPTRWIYELLDCIAGLHYLQVHSSVSKFWILDLTADKDFRTLAHKEVTFSVPYLTEFTLLLLRVSTFRKLYVKILNLKTSSMITGFKPFFILKTSVARICWLLRCLDTDLIWFNNC